MEEAKALEKINGGFIARAIGSWLVTAALALLIAALVVSRSEIGESSIGYISSALSFTAAFASGIAAAKGEDSGNMIKSLIAASAVTVLLLTIGFMFRGSDMKSSGILSVVSFTFSGCLLGSVMESGWGGKKKQSRRRFRR